MSRQRIHDAQLSMGCPRAYTGVNPRPSPSRRSLDFSPAKRGSPRRPAQFGSSFRKMGRVSRT